MADELQALLEKINQEGLKKADAERENIVSEAKGEAQRIVTEAKGEAKRLLEEARRDADMLRAKGEQSLRQAARDVLLSLREQLQERMRQVAGGAVREALAPERLAGILQEMMGTFLRESGSGSEVALLLSPAQVEEVRGHLNGLLAGDLKSRVELLPVRSLSGGFRLQVKGEDVLYDFSDEALAEALTAFVNPRLAEIVTGQPEGTGAGAEPDKEEDA